jgi:hypothetical protein
LPERLSTLVRGQAFSPADSLHRNYCYLDKCAHGVLLPSAINRMGTVTS